MNIGSLWFQYFDMLSVQQMCGTHCTYPYITVSDFWPRA